MKSLFIAAVAILCARFAVAEQVVIEGHNIMVDGKPHLPFGMVAHCSRDQYAQLKELGINSLHLDHNFSIFKADGSLDVTGMRDSLDAAHRNGQTVLLLLGFHYTPTWMFERYPDAHMRKHDGSVGQGGWHPYCLDHPGPRKEIEKCLEILVTELKDHPALMSWCLWNEPHLNGQVCYSKYTLSNFRKWIGRKYETIDALNAAWQTKYPSLDDVEAPADRSQTYWFERFDFQQALLEGKQEDPPPIAEGLQTNPVAWTDWMRFRQENYADFFRWEAGVIRRLDPDHPITTKIVPFDLYCSHAYGGGVNTRMWAESFCDAVGFDAYPHLDETFNVRWKADFLRDMAQGKPVWDTEMGFTFADKRGRPSPEAERTAFWMQFARGVNGRYFFLWSPKQDFFQRFTFPDASPEPGMYALQECSRQLEKHKDLLSQTRIVQPQVAVLHSMATGLHQSGDYVPSADLSTVIQCLYRKHIPYQYVTEGDAAGGMLKKFKALIVVGTVNASDQVLAGIEQFVKGGGHLLANARFAEFDDYGRKREAYPPRWMGVRAKGWKRSSREKVGKLSLERQSVDIYEKTVDVKVELDTYDSMPMRIVRKSPHIGLNAGAVIGTGDLYGNEDFQLPFASRGRHEQTREEIAALRGARVVATFEDNTPAIVTTDQTVYIARDTCWMSRNFADVIEQFVLNADAVRLAYARDASEDEVAPLDLVLCETPTKWVLYAINSPRTLHYDGSRLRDVRVALPGHGNPLELFTGRKLEAIKRGDLWEVKLNFNEGEIRILVGTK